MTPELAGQEILFPSAHPGCLAELCWCGCREMAAGCLPESAVGQLHPGDRDFDEAAAQVHGFELMTTVARPQAALSLPSFLAQVDGSAVSRGLMRPMMAVTLSVMVDRAGRRARSGRMLVERLGVSPGTQVGLLLFAADAVLERLWAGREKWVDAIASWQPAFVVAPDYSLWSNDSALTWRYNSARSLRLFERLQMAGLLAVPHVDWGNTSGLVEWARWLNRNRVDTIASDRQCIGVGVAFRQWLRELRQLREQLEHPPHLLVNGVDVGWKYRAIRQVWPELTITTNYVVDAVHHWDVRPDRLGNVVRFRSDNRPSQLFTARVELAENLTGVTDRRQLVRFPIEARRIAWEAALTRISSEPLSAVSRAID